MYVLKQIPEDFVVHEIIDVPQGKGEYTYFWMTKKNYNTLDALKRIASRLGIPLKRIGYAGNKDKRAITTQLCSAKGISKARLEKIKLKDITLSVVGTGAVPITLGMLQGNKFSIKIRNIDEPPKMLLRFINLFGPQRFGTSNALIGKLLVLKQFSEAEKLIGPLDTVSQRLLKLYVAAYQSLLWNKGVMLYDGNLKTFPLPGFGTEITDKKVKRIITTLLQEEKITLRDFIIKRLRGVSAEGTERNIWCVPENVMVSPLEKRSVVVTFSLPKGVYATEFIRQSLLPS
jgi:tRNA(Glu) U13 pseudouridine synthase TruD